MYLFHIFTKWVGMGMGIPRTNINCMKKSYVAIKDHSIGTAHEWRHPLLDMPTTLISRNAEQFFGCNKKQVKALSGK